MKYFFSFIILSTIGVSIHAQGLLERYSRFLTDPYGYVACRTSGPITIDGLLDEADWLRAAETEEFRDISGEGFPIPKYRTTARMLWDDDFLYIAAQLEEPNVQARLTQRDTVVYYDNDFEVFIDPDGDAQNYYEIEVNATGVVFDLFLQKPYRAPSRAYVTFSWDAPGMLLATHINGTLNDSTDLDRGWTVEMAIPRRAIAAEFDNDLQARRYLRLGMSRVEWLGRPEENWTWPSTGQVAMHMPERWGYVLLSSDRVGECTSGFHYPDTHGVEKLLWAMFYAQEEAFAKNKAYLNRTKDFHLSSADRQLLPDGAKIKVEATTRKYEITIEMADGHAVSIDHDGKISRLFLH